MTDFVLRVAELVLLCGAVVFVENRLHSGHLPSTILAAVAAIYARSRATAGMLELMGKHELNPRKQTFYYWLIIAFALSLWAGIVGLTTAIVPMIANAQAV